MSTEAARRQAADETVRRLLPKLYTEDFTLDELEDMADLFQAVWVRRERESAASDSGGDWAEEAP